jgi:hypothetical protein
MSTRQSARRTAPVTSRRPDPVAWRRALLVAAGDHRRLQVQPDGTVLVHNKPIR